MNTSHAIKSPWPFRLLFLVLAIFVAFAFQGSRGLYESTEGRYAECGREMLETGRYLEPTLNYQNHWTKPPMTYWAIAGGVRLLGNNEWGVRLYLAMAFVLTGITIYLLGATLWGETTGLLAGLIYISSPFPVMGANSVSTDTLLAFWELLALLFYFKARKSSADSGGTLWIILMWMTWGCAFLTKGPPALLPLIPLAIWHYRSHTKVRLWHFAGVAAFLFIVISWLTILEIRNPGVLSGPLLHEATKPALTEQDRNPQWYQPFQMYLPALTFGAGPWVIYLAFLFVRRRLFNPRQILSEIKRRDIPAFLLLWLLIPLVVFFLAHSRLTLYVLPLYAPIVLALARYLTLTIRPEILLKRTAIIAVATCVFLAAAKGGAARISTDRNMKQAYKFYLESAPGIPLSIVNQATYFGLQFYLNGPMPRLGLDEKRKGIKDMLNESLATAKETSRPMAYFIRKKDKKHIVRLLKKTSLPFEEHKNKFWYIYVVNPPTAKAAAAIPEGSAAK